MTMLLRRMSADGGDAPPVLLQAELRVRESTAPPMIK
jgi:hypothetical protein